MDALLGMIQNRVQKQEWLLMKNLLTQILIEEMKNHSQVAKIVIVH
ncbi:hypothetical protein N836_00345 [Leptolyngbya sp. Heron Island J]|nr:hypothetical protein N836_00345 [Leptolyngbya sp. Heron Island J]